ncbi:uncharacterized protein At4g13230 [Lotus japonicus]|uniref:uncharacterized protein At4g13230 n=1 Tax=Lotus japonicus TaxID=34305 RepID=UPI002584F42C|nr:uncharacterized protein At4g13230 [Lotus japonicus]
MAGSNLVTSLPKFGHAGAAIAKARAWNTRVFAAATPRPIQVPTSHDQEGSVTSDGLNTTETINNSLNEPLQDKAYSSNAAEHINNKAKDTANQISDKAQNITEKAKQTMQEAWDSTKNNANKAADNVLGKTQKSAEYVKENAETVKENMNSKNRN